MLYQYTPMRFFRIICSPLTPFYCALSTKMDDPTKCGSLRTYFDYDKDFPDDDRICKEVKELQVSSDSN